MLEWSAERHGVGDIIIDEQHRELFARVNLLLQALERGSAARDLGVLFTYLSGYVVTHFVDEERLMSDVGTADKAAHVAAHRAFAARLAHLKARFAGEGGSAALAEEVRGWVVDWAEGHIAAFDRRIGVST